jgi:hypothetical protein
MTNGKARPLLIAKKDINAEINVIDNAKFGLIKEYYDSY